MCKSRWKSAAGTRGVTGNGQSLRQMSLRGVNVRDG